MRVRARCEAWPDSNDRGGPAACRATTMLPANWYVPRRHDTIEVIGTALTAHTASPDHRPITRRRHLLDITQVAEVLGVQVRHVRCLVHERRIPYIKWGRLI